MELCDKVDMLKVAAQKLGFVNGDFVYIATWPYEHAQYGNLSWQYSDADDQVAKSAFGSLLVITPKITPTELRIRDMYKNVLPNSRVSTCIVRNHYNYINSSHQREETDASQKINLQKNPLVLATYLSFIATAKVKPIVQKFPPLSLTQMDFRL